MKRITIITIVLSVLFSCQEDPKDYALIEGEITNLTNEADSITIFIPDGYKKQIYIEEDGSFGDTLKVTDGKYQFKIGDEYGSVYLMNDESIRIFTDYGDFDEELNFEGEGISSGISNAYIQNYRLSSEYLNEKTLNLPENQFDSVMFSYKERYNQFKQKNSSLPPNIWEEMDLELEKNIEGFTEYYNKTRQIKEKYTGKPSPEFAMENIDGDIIKLSDFKGKYVYIDVWATWCGPCKREIPALKQLENKYKNKDIVFVSMSVDEPKNKEKWKTFVKEKDLQGVQIFAENAWSSEFIKSYEIKGIPRFILIDPNGFILNPDAPRPSDKALIDIFNQQNI